MMERSKQRGSEDGLNQEIPHEFVCIRTFEAIHLKFNLEAAKLLPLTYRGRILHGRPFTFKSVHGDTAITLVATGVEGAFVNEASSFAARGPWLQVLIPEELHKRPAQKLLQELTSNEIQLPKHYSWPERQLKISVYPDEHFDDPATYSQITT